MSLNIKPAHLQWIFALMATPLKAPQFFYEDADIFVQFFKRMDQKTTYRIVKQKSDANIEPSAFGRTIIQASRLDFMFVKNTDTQARPATQKFFRNAFLNIAAWYICPLIQANKKQCPYMTNTWIHDYLSKMDTLEKEKRDEYFDTILRFMQDVRPEWWIYPYEKVASKLGEDTQETILLFVGMFLAAHEEQKTHGLNKSIVEFIELISDIDNIKGGNAGENPIN
jgi:hypothetical protein